MAPLENKRHPAIVKVSPVLGADAVEIMFKHPDGQLEMLRISGTDAATADRVNEMIEMKIRQKTLNPQGKAEPMSGAEEWADKWLKEKNL